MTREVASFEKVFHWTEFLALESYRFLSLKHFMKLEFDVKIHCEINVKLVFQWNTLKERFHSVSFLLT